MATITGSGKFGLASPAQIARLEKTVGAVLPDAYKAFLREYNGGRPAPDGFVFDSTWEEAAEEDAVFCFFPLREGVRFQVENVEQLEGWPIHCAWADLQNDLESLDGLELDSKLLPIGTDGSGNYFCIVLEGDDVGRVVLFEHEQASVAPLADDFNAFLDGLRERKRND